ncbi:hypothetical protein GZH46_02612, partial [Fragariocoptes setiger]
MLDPKNAPLNALGALEDSLTHSDDQSDVESDDLWYKNGLGKNKFSSLDERQLVVAASTSGAGVANNNANYVNAMHASIRSEQARHKQAYSIDTTSATSIEQQQQQQQQQYSVQCPLGLRARHLELRQYRSKSFAERFIEPLKLSTLIDGTKRTASLMRGQHRRMKGFSVGTFSSSNDDNSFSGQCDPLINNCIDTDTDMMNVCDDPVDLNLDLKFVKKDCPQERITSFKVTAVATTSDKLTRHKLINDYVDANDDEDELSLLVRRKQANKSTKDSGNNKSVAAIVKSDSKQRACEQRDMTLLDVTNEQVVQLNCLSKSSSMRGLNDKLKQLLNNDDNNDNLETNRTNKTNETTAAAATITITSIESRDDNSTVQTQCYRGNNNNKNSNNIIIDNENSSTNSRNGSNSIDKSTNNIDDDDSSMVNRLMSCETRQQIRPLLSSLDNQIIWPSSAAASNTGRTLEKHWKNDAASDKCYCPSYDYQARRNGSHNGGKKNELISLVRKSNSNLDNRRAAAAAAALAPAATATNGNDNDTTSARRQKPSENENEIDDVASVHIVATSSGKTAPIVAHQRSQLTSWPAIMRNSNVNVSVAPAPTQQRQRLHSALATNEMPRHGVLAEHEHQHQQAKPQLELDMGAHQYNWRQQHGACRQQQQRRRLQQQQQQQQPHTLKVNEDTDSFCDGYNDDATTDCCDTSTWLTPTPAPTAITTATAKPTATPIVERTLYEAVNDKSKTLSGDEVCWRESLHFGRTSAGPFTHNSNNNKDNEQQRRHLNDKTTASSHRLLRPQHCGHQQQQQQHQQQQQQTKQRATPTQHVEWQHTQLWASSTVLPLASSTLQNDYNLDHQSSASLIPQSITRESILISATTAAAAAAAAAAHEIVPLKMAKSNETNNNNKRATSTTQAMTIDNNNNNRDKKLNNTANFIISNNENFSYTDNDDNVFNGEQCIVSDTNSLNSRQQHQHQQHQGKQKQRTSSAIDDNCFIDCTINDDQHELNKQLSRYDSQQRQQLKNSRHPTNTSSSGNDFDSAIASDIDYLGASSTSDASNSMEHLMKQPLSIETNERKPNENNNNNNNKSTSHGLQRVHTSNNNNNNNISANLTNDTNAQIEMVNIDLSDKTMSSAAECRKTNTTMTTINNNDNSNRDTQLLNNWTDNSLQKFELMSTTNDKMLRTQQDSTNDGSLMSAKQRDDHNTSTTTVAAAAAAAAAARALHVQQHHIAKSTRLVDDESPFVGFSASTQRTRPQILSIDDNHYEHNQPDYRANSNSSSSSNNINNTSGHQLTRLVTATTSTHLDGTANSCTTSSPTTTTAVPAMTTTTTATTATPRAVAVASVTHQHQSHQQQQPSQARQSQRHQRRDSVASEFDDDYDKLSYVRCSFFVRLLATMAIFFALSTIILLLVLLTLFGSGYRHENTWSNRTTQQLMGANDTDTEYVVNFNQPCLTPACVTVAASIINAMDSNIDPCDDFYMYSCGNWIKSNPLPEGKSSWGTFGKLWQENQLVMKNVLETSNFRPGSAEEKARIYYLSCLDTNETIEARGSEPMQDLINECGGWSISGHFDANKWDLQQALQIYHNQYNRGGLFSWAVGTDERNSSRTVIQIDQSGLGLPNRDYYLNKSGKNTVLESYLAYMIKVGDLMGNGDSSEAMKDVLEFEIKLAEITVPADQRRDDERMYHKYTLRELNEKSPFLNWTKYFADAFDYHSSTPKPIIPHTMRNTTGSHSNNSNRFNSNSNNNNSNNNQQPRVSATDEISSNFEHTQIQIRHKITDKEHVVIYSPEYFEKLSGLVKFYLRDNHGKTVLANYLAWSVVQSLVSTMPKQYREASKILRRALIGSEGQEITWRYCVSDTNSVMGFALGSMFVRSVFQGESKEKAQEMIDSIRNAFKKNLDYLAWMDENTRRLAIEKADKINEMIGFPDFILSSDKLDEKYRDLDFHENKYFENNIKVNIYALRENMEKISKPANKTEWEMTPPTVNAYYTPTKNQIVFPAGILQTPFYDASYPNSLNFGAMGVVMGHELTHAFDDQGREYDKDGNLHQWWYNATLQNFEERVKCFADQYYKYKIGDNHLNGKQTLGENIADNGGLKAAFRAFEGWLKNHHEMPLPGVNLTSRQLFFVGFAQVWCSASTPEALKLQIVNDVHAPAQYRVIGTLSNSYEFAHEFNCPHNSRMNPENKCISSLSKYYQQQQQQQRYFTITTTDKISGYNMKS